MSGASWRTGHETWAPGMRHEDRARRGHWQETPAGACHGGFEVPHTVALCTRESWRLILHPSPVSWSPWSGPPPALPSTGCCIVTQHGCLSKHVHPPTLPSHPPALTPPCPHAQAYAPPCPSLCTPMPQCLPSPFEQGLQIRPPLLCARCCSSQDVGHTGSLAWVAAPMWKG